MKKRFTESQIVAAIKKQESGISIKDISREYGISEATFYNWKAKYGGMEASDVSKLKELEKENAELKKMSSLQSLDLYDFLFSHLIYYFQVIINYIFLETLKVSRGIWYINSNLFDILIGTLEVPKWF
jgi:putative transposase